MITFKNIEDEVEVRTWAGGDQPKVIIINHEDFERIRLDLQRDNEQITFPTVAFAAKGVPVFGSFQVHKDKIKVI